MEPDLSNSISLHPHPFRTQSEVASTPPRMSSSHHHQLPPQQPQLQSSSSIPLDHLTPGGSKPGAGGEKNNSASSTAIEAMGCDDDHNGKSTGAHARHPLSVPIDLEVESQMVAGRLPVPLHDPYGLSQRYKSDQELAAIKANTSRKRDHVREPTDAGRGVDLGVYEKAKLTRKCIPFGRTAVQARRVENFYRGQNETIERLLKSVEEHRAEARQEQGEDLLKYQIAVWGSFVANVVLAILQLYGAISSGSLSLFTTMADAIFDPMSNVTLILTNRAVGRVDPSRFPSGKARLETVGNIVFCFLMTAVSFILIAFSVRELAEHVNTRTELNSFHLPSVIAVSVAFFTKLVLFLYTWSLKDRYSQIRILWQDHRNDLLINGFGILTSVGGSKLLWWLDPAGAIVLSLVVSVIWLRTAFTEFLLLVGVVASVEIQQLITYVCVTHSPQIRQIDTVRAYHAGPRLIAEVDIVMDPDATLVETHDVAEALQFKLESLPDVERAYVHVDYETTHKPEHFYKKDL